MAAGFVDLFLMSTPVHLRAQKAEHDELLECFEALYRRPDYEEEKKAAEAAWLASEDPTVLSLDIDELERIVSVMDAAGMISWDGSPTAPPSWDPPMLTGSVTSVVNEAAVTYATNHQAALESWHQHRAKDSVGISWWKLILRGRWIITASECGAARDAWAALVPTTRESIISAALDGDDAGWQGWIEFLGMAAVSDGFRVE